VSQQLRNGEADEAGMSRQRVQHLRRLGAEWVERGQAAALNVLVARRGVVVLREAYGRLGPEPDAPALPLDAVYTLSSITRVITATCAICLVEDGLFGLNPPAQDYVPEFTGKDDVTVHHLLTHSSGITPESVEPHAATKAGTGRAPAQCNRVPWHQHDPPWRVWASRVRTTCHLKCHPARKCRNCNLNYTLLGDLISRVAGQPVATFAEERLFEPLGMADTYLAGADPSRLPRLIRRATDDLFSALGNLDVLRTFPGAGSATATAWDMAIFGQTFRNGAVSGNLRVLSPASVAAMTRDQLPGIGAVYGPERFDTAGWGYGWNVKVDAAVAAIDD
jgi:serine-type D-Ala-D-Ala carboxypeptidase